METKSQRPKGRDSALSSLDAAISALDLARDATGMKPAKDAFGSANVLIAAIKVCFLPIHIGELLADVCRTRRLTKLTV